jgi:hypothetical protein
MENDDIPAVPEDADIPALEIDAEEPEIDTEDDEAITDPVGEPDEEPAIEARQAKPDRANQRVRQALAEAKEAKAEAARIQREMMELLKEQTRKPVAPIDPRVEQERLEMMTESERVAYQVNKYLAPVQAELQQLRLQSEVTNDRAAFNSALVQRPEFKKFESAVEERFQALLKKGQPQPRQAILEKIIGETVFKKGGKALAKAREAGAENIRRETTRPPNSRSNVSSDGGRADDFAAAEARLRRHFENGGTL